MQTPLFVGLIAMLAGSTLQDDIATTTRQLVANGYRPAEKATAFFMTPSAAKILTRFQTARFAG